MKNTIDEIIDEVITRSCLLISRPSHTITAEEAQQMIGKAKKAIIDLILTQPQFDWRSVEPKGEFIQSMIGQRDAMRSAEYAVKRLTDSGNAHQDRIDNPPGKSAE